MKIIITSPSLNPNENVSGISSVTNFIIANNKKAEYIHFELGRKDSEPGGWRRIKALTRRYCAWKRLLAKEPHAIIHYNFPLSKASILRDPWFMGYALAKGRKMTVHIHGGLFLTAPTIPAYLRRILQKVFAWRVPFIVLSETEKGILTDKFKAADVTVLPNCVDLSDASSFSGREKDNSSSPSPLRIGYLGRIEPNKGMSELLEAAKKLREEGIDFRLVFAGKEQTEGEYLPAYAAALGASFEYEGLVSGEKKNAFLRSLDAFVLPTYFEGLPMSLLETMSYGTVPIVTPVGSIPQVVENGKNGLFIKKKDTASIVGAVKKLNADRPLLRQLGDAARSTIFERFSTNKYISQLNNIYQRLISDFV